jgi:hypothetical protein
MASPAFVYSFKTNPLHQGWLAVGLQREDNYVWKRYMHGREREPAGEVLSSGPMINRRES